MAKTKFGFKGKLYLNTGSHGSPTWTEVKNVREVKVGGAFASEDATSRAGNGVQQEEPVLLGINVTGKVRSDDGDTTGFVAMETAFLTRGVLDVLALDGDVLNPGNRGYRADMKLHKFEEDQDNGKVLWRDFELKPCISDNAPQYGITTGTAGAATITLTNL